MYCVKTTGQIHVAAFGTLQLDSANSDKFQQILYKLSHFLLIFEINEFELGSQLCSIYVREQHAKTHMKTQALSRVDENRSFWRPYYFCKRRASKINFV